ncbi:TetR/AcrR family transcriptional regulator [Leptospira langatensis]|uniref:TetR/AcrR family transcriptional regulator n=1 Tax=Leptospira langatensis TaxID=2484983 RepID=A0A5F1ZQV3_9LEPT|nr:TetR/AcrR family transcriptional regulator [Leptospira langatensis]TGK02618.1 TetR/AcrR family transcriptional regulator [Leptospira langatensis]TGL40180.1 TetR/AcrR family transcriptional regulator [Leptospira langatensis]
MANKRKSVRNPVQDRSIASKERIISAAYQLVKKKGYANTGIRDIASLAEVSVGTFYMYYKDKNAIGFEVLRKYGEEFYGKLASEITSHLPKKVNLTQIIFEILVRMKKVALENTKLHKEFIILSLSDRSFAAVLKLAEQERIQAELPKIMEYFGDQIIPRSKPAAIYLAQRVMDDITTYMVLQGFSVSDDEILKETALMISSYLERKE